MTLEQLRDTLPPSLICLHGSHCHHGVVTHCDAGYWFNAGFSCSLSCQFVEHFDCFPLVTEGAELLLRLSTVREQGLALVTHTHEMRLRTPSDTLTHEEDICGFLYIGRIHHSTVGCRAETSQRLHVTTATCRNEIYAMRAAFAAVRSMRLGTPIHHLGWSADWSTKSLTLSRSLR